MSRWKFIFRKDERKDNKELLQKLSKARTDGTRQLLKVYIDVTTRCDGHCLHCFFHPNHNQPEMPLEEIFELQTYLQNGGVEALTYAGGDPIARGDHLRILEHGERLGLKQTFCTRGWLKDLSNIEQVAKANPEHIQFSCDPVIAGLSIHDELERIKQVGELVSRHPCHVSWVTTLTKGAEQYLVQILEAIKNSGGKEFRIHRVLPWGRMLENPTLIPTNEEFIATMRSFTQIFFERFANGILLVEETPSTLRQCLPENTIGRVNMIGCPVGQTALTIGFDGSVYLCPILKHKSLKLGDSWRLVFEYWDTFQKTAPFSQSVFTGTICEGCNDFNNCLGGCRCQAVAKSGCRWDVDPTCAFCSTKKGANNV
ncbi:MAG: radical SAM protein [Sedimentisphaerales bacterium]